AEDLDEVLAMVDQAAHVDWRSLVPELSFSRSGEYFCFEADAATGLALPDRPTSAPDSAAAASRNVTWTYRVSKAAHGAMFTPGRGLWNWGAKRAANARDPWQGPAWL